jgi:hypothetical protein
MPLVNLSPETCQRIVANLPNWDFPAPIIGYGRRGCVYHVSIPACCGGIFVDPTGVVVAASIDLARFLWWRIDAVERDVNRRGVVVLAWIG